VRDDHQCRPQGGGPGDQLRRQPYNPYYAVGSLDYLGQGDATVTSLQQTTASRWTKVSGC
jgi:hypothetical protein